MATPNWQDAKKASLLSFSQNSTAAELLWLQSIIVATPKATNLNDAWNQYLIEQGFTKPGTNDKQFAWLGSLGYTGSFMDRWQAYWPTQLTPVVPSVPNGLNGIQASETQLDLSWFGSSGAPQGYRLYRDATLLIDQVGLTFSDVTTVLGATYAYTVSSYNAQGESVQSAPFNITILDVTPPSVPTGLAANPISGTQIDLSWNASSDNVGVTGYRLYRDAVPAIDQVGLTFSDTGLTAGTAYTYTVEAYDAEGNVSGISAGVIGTTPVVSTHALTVAGMLTTEAGMDLSTPAGSLAPTTTVETGQVIYKLRSAGANLLILDLGISGGEQ